MRIVGLDLAAAFERRRLPGFQGVAAITDAGEIVYISPSLDGRFGVDAAAVVGRNFVEFIDLDDAGQAIDSFGGVLAGPGFHPALELRVRTTDAETTTIDVVAENLLATEFAVVLMHIADARERGIAAHLLNAQAEVVRQIALGGSLSSALEAVSGFVTTAMPGFGSVAYVREGDCFVGWGRGLPPDAVTSVEAALAGDPLYIGSTALADAEPKVAQDSPTCRAWPHAGPLVGPAVRSIWSVPIRHDRNSPCVGCLEIYGPDPVMPRDDDWIVLQLVSRLAAVAVDHSIMQTRLAQDANVDPLTSIPNRRVITGILDDALERGERPIVCFIDLDHLKVVNDGLGHEAGDQVIMAAADRLRFAVGAVGAVGRFGGDEFVAVADATRISVERLGDACVDAFVEPIEVAGRTWKVSASVGIVEVDAHAGPGEVLRDADAAMYEAKRAGRGRWVRFESSTRESVVRRLRLEQQLRRGIDEHELQSWFQPIVRSSDWSLFGAEALARWRLPSGEWVPPVDFIALAEELGLIDDLGLHMIERALVAKRVLAAQGYADIVMSVNLSPVQLRSERLFERLKLLTLTDAGLQLEMTEQHIVDDSSATLADLQRLLSLGVGLAIDDFGTGYSSLGALHRIPAGTLKIDRSLVAQSDTASGVAVVRAVVGVARAFGMTTVAEGVETYEQALCLRELGVSALQGFLFARPEPLDALLARLLRGGWPWDVEHSVLEVDPQLQVSVP